MGTIASLERLGTHGASDCAQDHSVGILSSIEGFVGQRVADGINGSLGAKLDG